MAAKVTRDVLESYLDCKTKAHLRLAGQQGSVSDYENLLVVKRQEVRQTAIDKILAKQHEGEVVRDISLTADALRAGPSIVLDTNLEDGLLSVRFDGLKRGGWAVEAGGLPLRPDALPRRAKGRQGAEAPAGAIRFAPIPGPREAARQRGSVARAGV